MSQGKGIAELSDEERSWIAKYLGPKLEEMEKSIERFHSRTKRLEEEMKKQEEEMKKQEEMFNGATTALANFRKSLEKKGGRKRTRRMRNKRLRKSNKSRK